MATPAAVAANVAANSSAEQQQQQQQQEKRKIEYNPRWKGYLFIGGASLVSYASISGVSQSQRNESDYAVGLVFGMVPFFLSIIILIHDRSQRFCCGFNYTKAFDGKFEGYTLLFLTIWWIAGVADITKVHGIGYAANNIYYSSWLSWFSCIYTLNKWSSSKDILTIAELTGLSATLKSWYVLFISSLVLLFTCVDLHVHLSGTDREDASFGVGLGLISSLVSLLMILVHYRFITFIKQGGWVELTLCAGLFILFILGMSIFTQHEGLAATLGGTLCGGSKRRNYFDNVDECSIVVEDKEPLSCRDLPRQVPGSNLYFACWTCFGSSVSVAFRWKAAQALQFAQTQQRLRQQEQEQQEERLEQLERSDSMEVSSSFVSDLDDFEDAVG